MIQLLLPGATSLRTADSQNDLPNEVLWIDLLEPDHEVEARVERFLGINIPTREEMREIEESSRLYREGEALYMTVRVLFGVDTGRPRTRAITFVLTRAAWSPCVTSTPTPSKTSRTALPRTTPRR